MPAQSGQCVQLPEPQSLRIWFVLLHPDTFSRWCIFTLWGTIHCLSGLQATTLEQGTTKVAKSKTTKKVSVAKSKKQSAGDQEVTVCRRKTDRRQPASSVEPTEVVSVAPPAAPLERRKKVQRRRQIDPTTCERDYSQDEIEFMHALDAYKRSSGRMFPTCSEILEVVRGLGYSKPLAEGVELTEPVYTDAELDDEEAELAEMF